MSFNDFFQIPKELSREKYVCNKTKLADVHIVTFVKGSAEMFWKTSYTEENSKSARFLQ